MFRKREEFSKFLVFTTDWQKVSEIALLAKIL